jgi:hypothetical protein
MVQMKNVKDEDLEYLRSQCVKNAGAGAGAGIGHRVL